MQDQIVVKNAVGVFFINKILAKRHVNCIKTQLLQRLGFYGAFPDEVDHVIRLLGFSLSQDKNDGTVKMNVLVKDNRLYLQLIWPVHACVKECLTRLNKLNREGLFEITMEIK